LTLTTIN